MSDNKLKEAVRQLAGTHLKDDIHLLICEVDSVDVIGRKCACSVVGGQDETSLPDVQLMASIDDGLLYVPSVGSTVIVCYSTRVLPFVALFSQLDQVVIIAPSIQFNDGSFGGLTKIQALTDTINILQKDINTLKTGFSSWVTVPNDGGAALKAIAADWFGTQLEITDRADLENTNTTHGE